MEVLYRPIGRVDSPLTTTEEAPRQGFLGDVAGRIDVYRPYRRGLDDYPFDRVLVIWDAERADRRVIESDRWHRRGIFTTSSMDRPNPICLTKCQVSGIDRTGMNVEGIDMLDGSPVIDLKPPRSRFERG